MPKLREYFFFTKSYPYTFGLLLILILIDMTIVEVLFQNLVNAPANKNIKYATLIVNIREGVSEILKVFVIIFIDVYMKGIGGVMLFNVIYIVGLVMLYMFQDGKMSNLVMATLTISLGKIGSSLLIGFIGDHLDTYKDEKEGDHLDPDEDQDKKEDAKLRLTLGWWVFPWVLSAIIATLIMPSLPFSFTTYIIPLTSLLAVTLVIFWVGEECLVIKDKVMSPDEDNRSEMQELSLIVKEVFKINYLVFVSLILYTIIAAAGTTFFIQQARRINSGFPFVTFLIFKHALNVVVSVLFSKRGTNLFTHLAWGMLFSFSSSVFAFWTEAYPYGIWVLTPQYLFLGASEGLVRDAFEGYFKDRIKKNVVKKLGRDVSENLRRYIIQFIMGVGNFLSYATLSVLLLLSTIDASDLRLYYKMLMVVTSTSLLMSLYLRLEQDPVTPQGLSSGIFSPTQGVEPPTAAVMLASPPCDESSDELESTGYEFGEDHPPFSQLIVQSGAPTFVTDFPCYKKSVL